MHRAALLILSILTAFSVAAKDSVVLGVAGDSAVMQREMAGIVKHVNSSAIVGVELKVFPSHDDLYKALAAGKVDLAFLGSVKYIQAHHEAGAQAIVADGPEIRSVLAVASTSPIKTVEELRGKRVAFGYEDSTTSHLIPLLLLSKHGLRQNDVKASFLGNNQQVLADAVLSGKADVCAVADGTFARNRMKLRTLAESDGFPGSPIVARKNLAASTVAELRRMFLSYKPAGAAAGQYFAKGAVAVSDSDYNRVRFLVKSLFNKMYL